MNRSRVLVTEMYGSIAGRDDDRISNALEVRETFLAEDAKLVDALRPIRGQLTGLNAPLRKKWNVLAQMLDSHFVTIHACAQALRVRLELLKKHSKEDVDQVIHRILARLPNRTDPDGERIAAHEQEYDKAALELEQEQHEYLGFVDVVKALLMWVETIEERVLRNRSLRVDEMRTRNESPKDDGKSRKLDDVEVAREFL